MKNILLLISLILTSHALAVCTSPISRTNFSANTVLSSITLNSQLNALYTQTNELPGDCITAETVTSAKILNGTIVNADINTSAAIARSKLAAMNYTLSASSETFNTGSTTNIDVTNLSAAITTTGGPVEITLVSSGFAFPARISITKAAATSTGGEVLIVRGSTEISRNYLSIEGASGTLAVYAPPSTVKHIDFIAAGTYTYKIQVAADSGSSLSMTHIKLLVREL